VTLWGGFIHTGTISTIWPMFGIANQLLAAMALSIGTTVIIKSGKAATPGSHPPLSFVAVTTLTAGWLTITDNFLPRAAPGADASPALPELPERIADGIMMTCIVLTIANCVYKWFELLSARSAPESRCRRRVLTPSTAIPPRTSVS